MRRVVICFLVVSGLGLAGSISNDSSAVDIDTAIIKCPEGTSAKLDWKDKIGSDPAFSRSSEHAANINLHFIKMERRGQKVTCIYEYGPTRWEQEYEYTVKRKIRSCKQQGADTLRCEVEER